jgi:hypothetical protein
MGDESKPKTVAQAFKSLVSVDCIRWSRLAETSQYAAIFAVLAFFAGVGIDSLCSLLYPCKTKESEIETIGQFFITLLVMVLQVTLSAIGVFYIRKVGQLFPLTVNFCPPKYIVGYHVPERVGEIAIALAYVGAMGTLLRNLDRMRLFITKKDT